MEDQKATEKLEEDKREQERKHVNKLNLLKMVIMLGFLYLYAR